MSILSGTPTAEEMTGGCRVHGLPGQVWPAWYRCVVCGCGGSFHGLHIWPRPIGVRAHRLQMGNDTAHETDLMFCWEHWPGRTQPEPAQIGLDL